MAVVPGVHRADHADVVDDAGRVRQQLRDLGAALAVLGELPRAAEELLAGPVDEAEDTSPPYSVPWCFVSSGLGSSRSTCDGPPCMNSEIIAFAFGAKCGLRGSEVQRAGSRPAWPAVSAASRPSRWSRCARAKAPTPNAVFDRNARRSRIAGQST